MGGVQNWSVFPLYVIGLAAVEQVLDAAGLGRLVAEGSRVQFVLISCVLGGWAGFRSGKSLAGTWQPYGYVVAAMIPMTIVVRWIHFALFNGKLLSPHYLLIDFVIVLVAATLGYRMVRAAQMARQYRWLYERTGPFGWRRAGAALRSANHRI